MLPGMPIPTVVETVPVPEGLVVEAVPVPEGFVVETVPVLEVVPLLAATTAPVCTGVDAAVPDLSPGLGVS